MAIKAVETDQEGVQLQSLSRSEQLESFFAQASEVVKLEAEKELAKAKVNELNNQLKQARQKQAEMHSDMSKGQLTLVSVAVSADPEPEEDELDEDELEAFGEPEEEAEQVDPEPAPEEETVERHLKAV